MQKNIIYEDNDIIVVYKPAGIATQTAKLSQRDMVSELKNYLKKKNPEAGVPYLSLVHRLDQPVCGLLVFGKTREAGADLSRQLTKGLFQKHYYAIIAGCPEKKTGTLKDYLYKDGKTNLSQVVDPSHADAKEAILTFHVEKTLVALETLDELSLVEIALKTGRHHQIRVQMAHAGMALIGDMKYANEETKALSREVNCRSVALCAYQLSFLHPSTGKRLTFTQLPQDEIFEPFFSNSL